MEVGGCPAQVRLQAEAHVRVLGLEPLVHRHGRLRVGASLHVDPEGSTHPRRVLAERRGVAEGGVRVQVKAQLGELDADLAVELQGRDPVEQAVVVARDLLRLPEVGEVLSQAGKQHADAVHAKRLGGSQRFVDGLARHESAHRTTREWEARKVLLQPSVAGHPQQDLAHVSASSGEQLGAANLPRPGGGGIVHKGLTKGYGGRSSVIPSICGWPPRGCLRKEAIPWAPTLSRAELGCS